MNFKRFVASALVAATCAIVFTEAGAQSLKRDSGPAEIPPASFTANQYVDSKGCVYIRAGVDGNTNWVPRVSRSRKVVCGMSPSIRPGTAVAAATTPAAAAKVAAPVEIGVNSVSPKSPSPAAEIRPAKKTVASVLAPKPVRTVASKPAATVRKAPTIQAIKTPARRVVKQPRVQAVAPKVQQVRPRIVQVAPKTQAVQPRRVAVQPRRVAGASTCQGASAISQQYIGRNGGAVRCGPQSEPFVTRAGDVKGGTFRSANGNVLTNVSPNAIVVPRHVYEQQQAARVVAPAPQGYREAWTDDRLNPRRAHQTLGGKAQMDLIWTQTVPRRLILRSTGRDVTRVFPGLRYPYTSEAQQHAALAQGVQVISTKSQAPRKVKRRVVAQKQPVRQKAVVSTRSATPRKPAQAAGMRYVQVATFGVASNAQNTAHRLQRMGLPVRIGKFTRGGKQMRIVLAGPFASSAHTNGALTAVRNAGFRDAFLRK